MNQSTAYSVHSSAYGDSIVIPNPVVLLGFTVYNSGGAQFIQLHDAAAEPANGAVPIIPLPVAASAMMGSFYGSEGRYFANGLVICNSSTAPTKTSGAADCWFDVQVKFIGER